MRSPPCLAARIIAAMRVTPTSTRRSDEISFVMNAKPSRSRAWNSGTTLIPWMPQTTASPARISRSFRQSRGPPRSRSPRPCAGDRPAPTRRRCARMSDDWSSSRSPPARSRRDRPARYERPRRWRRGTRATPAPRGRRSARRGVFDVTRIDTNDGSSLVRPILNSRTSNAASWRTTVSNIAFMS